MRPAERWADLIAGARAFGRGIRFVAGMLRDAAPRLAAAMVALTLVQAALPVLNVRLAQVIVNDLAGRPSASGLIGPLLAYLALHLAGAGLAPTLNAIQAIVNERSVGHVNLRVLGRL